MRLVYCLDENYIKYTRASILSFRRHNPGIEITLVTERPISGIGEDENVIIKLPTTFRNRGLGDRISNAAYLKLFLTQLPYDKIIYVDGDTICQKPLDDLLKIRCPYINLCESHEFGKQQAMAIGHKHYGLTGMMVMNLKNLRLMNFTEKCLEVERTAPTPSTGWQHDETCINIAMGDRLNFIDRKYNYCHNRKYDNPIPERDAYILHYVGADKNAMLYGDKYKEIAKIGKEIRGRRVAIVGNAKSIFDTKYGSEIDSHEFIIRFNKGFCAKPESQGTKTTMLMCGCTLSNQELLNFKARFVVNRSRNYFNITPFTISTPDRDKLKKLLGSQPSTGFMAIDVCIYFGAKSIDLYGFDWEATPTFYNPIDYKTKHDYPQEKDIVFEYEKEGLVKIHK